MKVQVESTYVNVKTFEVDNDWWEMLCTECGHSYQAQEKNIETQKCPNCQGGTGTLPIDSGTIQ